MSQFLSIIVVFSELRSLDLVVDGSKKDRKKLEAYLNNNPKEMGAEQWLNRYDIEAARRKRQC